MKLRSSQLAVGGVGKGSISTIAVDEESGKESSGKAISTVTTKKATIASTRSKRKAPPESIIEASGDPGIAAAATTLVYKLQYGKESVEDLTGMDVSSVEESSAAVSVQSDEFDDSDASYLF